MASAVLFLVGGVLALVSAFVAWWSYSYHGFTISFFPGSSYTESAGSPTTTQTFASNGLGPVGDLYETILALALIVGVLAIIAGILVLASVFGRPRANWQTTVKGLVIATILIMVVAVVLAPAVQPWAVNDSSNHSRCGGLNGTSPCNSFWGSQLGASWGGTTGWYLALAALIATIGGLLLWRSSRAEHTLATTPAN